MFSHLNLEGELARVNNIRLPTGCCVSMMDEEFCKCYLYHLVVKQYGVFRDAPVFHLPHNNLPLVEGLWSFGMTDFYYRNQACFYVLTDGNFEFPDPLWVRRGRRYGPIFSDGRLRFHGQRYVYKHVARHRRLHVDVFTASARHQRDADQFDFRFRALKFHNPYVYNYRAGGRGVVPRRVVYEHFNGPYGDVPHPFQP